MALIGYSLGRFSAFPGYATFAWCSRSHCTPVVAGRWSCTSAGVAGLSVALLLQPPGVATASSWISTLLTVTVAWLAGENLRSRRARRRDELDEAHRQAEQGPRGTRLIQQQAEEERRAISGGAAADRPRPPRRGGPLDERHRRPGRRRAPRHRGAARDRSATPSAASRSPPGKGLVEMRRLLGLLRSEGDTTDDVRHGTGRGSARRRPAPGPLPRRRSAGRGGRSRPRRRLAAGPRHLRVPDHAGRPHQRAAPRRTGGIPRMERSPTELRIEIRDDGRALRSRPRPDRGTA